MVWFILLLFFSLSFGAYYCADTGFYYSDQNLCNRYCSNSCQVLLPKESGLSCDTQRFEFFIYNPQTRKTVAITKGVGFWEDFQRLLVVEDASDNEAGRQLVEYTGAESAWIGLFDPNKTQSFNSVNPERFVWWNGRPVSYQNWRIGEPNNVVFDEDIGVVPILGEFWVEMYPDGTWNDEGYHKYFGGDYKPRQRALVMFEGQLDCVSGVPQKQQTTTQDMVSLFCSGQTPCYLCTDGNEIKRCDLGSNNQWLCPLGRVQCNANYICPSGSSYNANTGKCEVSASVSYSCPSGSSYNANTGKCEKEANYTAFVSACYGVWCFRVEINGTQIRTSYGTYNPPYSPYVDIYGSGSTRSGNNDSYYQIWIETNYGKVRLMGNCYSSGWASWTSDFDLRAGDGCEWVYDVAFQKSGDRVRVCVNGSCSNWATLTASCPSGYTYNPSTRKCETSATVNYSCPSGYTYNSSTKKCEASPSISYSCPLGNYPCVRLSDGKYYCSSNQCYDATTTPVVSEDTQEGATDIPADGVVDESGCRGTVYVFNGRDMRCRPPGVQTGFSDCCKKTKTWFGLGQCSETERQLSALRSWGRLDGNCHFVGEYCAEKWLGVCVQKKRTYCCFSSPLARIIHEQGRPQLGIGWGTPKSPNCRGFTLEEFQKIDFSKIDFSEWISEEVSGKIVPQMQNTINNVINQLQRR